MARNSSLFIWFLQFLLNGIQISIRRIITEQVYKKSPAEPLTGDFSCLFLLTLIKRQTRIHFLGPGVDAAFKILHFLEACAGKDLDRTRGA